MDNEKIEQRIRRLAEHTAPDQLNGILEACEARKGNVITMNEVKNKKKRNRYLPIAVAAALLLVCLGGYIGFNYGQGANQPADAGVASVITLDVNPSLSISVDENDKVVTVTPLNDDARVVIGDMNFTGSSLDVTVNALIGSMLVNGYLDDIRNSILVSVENGDAAKAASLQAQVSALISSAVGDGGFEASVLTQTVSATSESAAIAEQYGISEGKAELILKVVAADPTLTVDSLANLSVNDISLIASSRGLSNNTVTQTGTASDKGYIGIEAAKAAAYAHAGVSASDVLFVEVDFDSEHGVMVYEVEFYAGTTEYEYDINALTGEVVKYEQEKTGTGVPAAGNNGNYIGEAAAKAAALSHSGVSEADVCWLKSDFDRDDGVYIYELEFAANGVKYDYEINALTGEVVKFEQEQTGNQAGTGSGNTGTGAGTGNQYGNGGAGTGTGEFIGEAAAKAAALANAGVSESEVTRLKCELDRKHGSYVYEVEFDVGRMEYEYEIDAYTGAILKSEHDYDD